MTHTEGYFPSTTFDNISQVVGQDVSTRNTAWSTKSSTTRSGYWLAVSTTDTTNHFV